MIITDELTKEITIQRYDGIDVVREDLCSPHLPSGKLRALIPYFRDLKAAGHERVVNHAVSYSNSHAIVSYAARAVGLHAISYANCKYATLQIELARQLGGEIILEGGMQLGPLRARMKAKAPAGVLQLPWGLACPEALMNIAKLVDQCGTYDYHVVPVGAGGYIWGVAQGIVHNSVRWGYRPKVIGVCSTGTLETNYKRLNALKPQVNVELVDRTTQVQTPFESDPHYEWWVWPKACRLRDLGHSVCFWLVGRPLIK